LYFFLEVSGTEEDCAKWVKLTLRLTQVREPPFFVRLKAWKKKCEIPRRGISPKQAQNFIDGSQFDEVKPWAMRKRSSGFSAFYQ